MALKDNYITITQAAKELNVTRQTISRWVAKGDVPAEKIGRETLINKKDLTKYRFRKLSETAADNIMALYDIEATEYCREKGYIKPSDRVEFAYDTSYKDNNGNIIKLSTEDILEIKRRLRPILAGFLRGFDLAITEMGLLSEKKSVRQRRNKSKE